ncbi:MAG: TonB-dependent receptor [Paludibacter sp.]|nr:TonB-dependent receptor [Paludibacter sp.]
MRCSIVLLFLFVYFSGIAENKFTLSGYITDFESGECLSGASVTVAGTPLTGVVSNNRGYYILMLSAGDYTMRVSYLGYESREFHIKLNNHLFKNFRLRLHSNILSEVDVSAYKKQHELANQNEGLERTHIREIKNIPVLLGEQDIMKTLTLSPGVKSIGESSGNIYVRGSNNSHNLVLLDQATVLNTNHLLGFFSTFNSDAIRDVTFYKGTAPAEFGGRLASVMDIRMNEGNNSAYHVGGGIGLISSRLSVEGPLIDNEGSFIISGRRTYADAFLKFFSNQNIRNNELYFYDLNLKANYKINEENNLSLSAFAGRDRLFIPGHFAVDWGNMTATLKWMHVFNGKFFSNTSLIYSNFDYKVDIIVSPSVYSLGSGINNLNVRQDFQYYLNESNTFDFGYQGIFHTLYPGELDADVSEIVNPMKIQNRYGFEQSVYWSHSFKPSALLNINYGLRFTGFYVLGPGDFFTYLNGLPVDTSSYASGKIVKSYFVAEPRFNLSYNPDHKQSFKFSYTRNSQFLHSISSSTASLPTDIWLISGKNIKPQINDQLSSGYYRNMKDGQYWFYAEIYYKWLSNQIDLKNGADIRVNEHIEGELLFGKGRAYGLELMMKKETGRLNGWIAYTLSRTELNIDGINGGKWYPARQDATHDISVVGLYNLSDVWSFSAMWVYQTGNAVTFPSGKYEVDGEIRFLYKDRNAHRMPDYHRMDLGATYKFKKRKNYESSLNFSIYNVYGRKNAFTIDFEEDPHDASKTRAVMTYLFTVMPSVTYNFRF